MIILVMGLKVFFYKFMLISYFRYLLGIFDVVLKNYWIKLIVFVGKYILMNFFWWYFFGCVFFIGDICIILIVLLCYFSKVFMKEENVRIFKVMNMIMYYYWFSRDSKNLNIKSVIYFYICMILFDLIILLVMFKFCIWIIWIGWLFL